jgi:hypothetical protein
VEDKFLVTPLNSWLASLREALRLLLRIPPASRTIQKSSAGFGDLYPISEQVPKTPPAVPLDDNPVSQSLDPRGALIRVPKRLPSYPANLCPLLFGASLRSSPEGKPRHHKKSGNVSCGIARTEAVEFGREEAASKKRTGRADQNADRSEHDGAPEYSGQDRRTRKNRPIPRLLEASADCPQKLTLYLGVEHW